MSCTHAYIRHTFWLVVGNIALIKQFFFLDLLSVRISFGKTRLFKGNGRLYFTQSMVYQKLKPSPIFQEKTDPASEKSWSFEAIQLLSKFLIPSEELSRSPERAVYTDRNNW